MSRFSITIVAVFLSLSPASADVLGEPKVEFHSIDGSCHGVLSAYWRGVARS